MNLAWMVSTFFFRLLRSCVAIVSNNLYSPSLTPTVRTLNAAGAAPLKPYLDMLRKTDFTSLKSRTKTIAELHRADNSGLFIPFVMEDREDPSKYAIYLAQGSTGLPPQLMMLPFFSEILVDKVAAFLNGFRILDVDARPLARKIVQLEFRLAKMAMRGPPVSFMDNNGLDRVSLEEVRLFHSSFFIISSIISTNFTLSLHSPLTAPIHVQHGQLARIFPTSRRPRTNQRSHCPQQSLPPTTPPNPRFRRPTNSPLLHALQTHGRSCRCIIP